MWWSRGGWRGPWAVYLSLALCFVFAFFHKKESWTTCRNKNNNKYLQKSKHYLNHLTTALKKKLVTLFLIKLEIKSLQAPAGLKLYLFKKSNYRKKWQKDMPRLWKKKVYQDLNRRNQKVKRSILLRKNETTASNISPGWLGNMCQSVNQHTF